MIVTHDADLATQCQRHLELKDGQLIEQKVEQLNHRQVLS